MKITECPTCGEKSIHSTKETIERHIRGKTVRYYNVPHLKCDSCGERLFDRAAGQIMSAQRRERGYKRAV